MANKLLLKALLGLALTSSPAWAGATQPTVKLPAGVLRGEAAGTGAVFKGVPYAAAPVGDRRWRSPQPAPTWSGVRDAIGYAPACVQPDQGWNHAPAASASEDCLYLNVWTPKLASAAKLPVMVWIHGGAFVGGSGSEATFDGAALSAHGVVVVTLNYRLGVFGFLAHRDLSSTSPDKTSGNYGLQDQLAALEWVRDNIAKFGGDPGKVTLFGQSAGGASVIDLVASPRARGLMRGAIVQSGAILRQEPMANLAQAETIGDRFAAGAPLSDLRALGASEVLARWGGFARQSPANQIGPIVDGRMLADDPQAVYARHGEAKIPMIIGNNAREGFQRLSDAELPAAIARLYGPKAASAAAQYGAAPDPVLGTAAATFVTDSNFRCGSVITASRHAQGGGKVFSYQFEQSLPGRPQDGAAHSYELPFVFGNLAPDGILGGAFTPEDRGLSDLMALYWTNFAKTGDPNGGGAPAWPRYDSQKRAYVRLASALRGHVTTDAGLRREACDLFEQTLTR